MQGDWNVWLRIDFCFPWAPYTGSELTNYNEEQHDKD